jgi:hypothetical protein
MRKFAKLVMVETPFRGSNPLSSVHFSIIWKKPYISPFTGKLDFGY